MSFSKVIGNLRKLLGHLEIQALGKANRTVATATTMSHSSRKSHGCHGKLQNASSLQNSSTVQATFSAPGTQRYSRAPATCSIISSALQIWFASCNYLCQDHRKHVPLPLLLLLISWHMEVITMHLSEGPWSRGLRSSAEGLERKHLSFLASICKGGLCLPRRFRMGRVLVGQKNDKYLWRIGIRKTCHNHCSYLPSEYSKIRKRNKNYMDWEGRSKILITDVLIVQTENLRKCIDHHLN